jgi:hypothetical protein
MRLQRGAAFAVGKADVERRRSYAELIQRRPAGSVKASSREGFRMPAGVKVVAGAEEWLPKASEEGTRGRVASRLGLWDFDLAGRSSRLILAARLKRDRRVW